jgi:DNA-binding winged helix-turn-helix (wHTH) protein
MRFEFGEFVLDTDARVLRRGTSPVPLSPKAYRLLEVLIASRPRALGKQELMDALWPGTFVVEANLANLIGEVRAALGDPRHAPRFVRTVHRFGYAFLDADAAATPRTRHSPVWQARWHDRHDRRVELPTGRHVIGRGDQQVRVDDPSVSRAHGRIDVAPGGLTYEDLDSKNGSFLNGEPIDGIVDVRSGDVITVGTVEVTFVRARNSSSTQSVERRAVRPRRG